MDLVWLVAGVVGLGFLHGVLPDHGWPIAAMYALDRTNRYLYGFAAGLILGIGHLTSSIALVLAFFWLSSFTDIAESNLLGVAAGSVLVLLGLYEYRYGGHHHHDREDHDHGPEPHDHTDDHGHGEGHDHDHRDPEAGGDGPLARVRAVIPGFGGHDHHHGDEAETGSLWSIGAIALVLGFAHEEPIQIIAICAGSAYCLELMVVYSLAVIVAILVPTLLLIAGYERHRETVERYTPYLSTVTAAVLVLMGTAFVVGIF